MQLRLYYNVYDDPKRNEPYDGKIVFLLTHVPPEFNAALRTRISRVITDSSYELVPIDRTCKNEIRVNVREADKKLTADALVEECRKALCRLIDEAGRAVESMEHGEPCAKEGI
jgi:hypothetical protein